MATAYDLIVIGAGPGGYPAALRAAELGRRTAVIECRELGGTCLNRGCIPTKTLLHATGLYRETLHASEAGLRAESLEIDGPALRARKNQVVETLQNGIAAQFKKHKVDVYYGIGTIEGEHQVTVTPNKVVGELSEETSEGPSAGPHAETPGNQPSAPIHLEAASILIATGSTPAAPPIPGSSLEGVVDSDIMLEEVNMSLKSLVIIGGGVIGMEFAQIYSDIGCQVTVLEAMDRILPGMDREIAQNLKMIGKKRNIDIHTGAMVKEIQKTADGSLLCRYEEKGGEKEAAGERVLIATGRRPNTANLFGESMKGRITETRGCIQVDDDYRTSVPGIYAIGDVIGGIQLAHAATAEGITAVEHLFGHKPRYTAALIPSCVYTDPEIAVIGMTAEEAKEAGIEVITGKYLMSMNGKSLLSGQERGFIKLTAEKDSRQVIGAQLMCARATDMISMLELAIQNHLTVEQLAELILPHPTFCEGIGEAAFDMAER
ncbi:MAG: dihydrolipoyl dehydrogenase [Hungatella hathewayi]|nr:dihydrolipoyl dehydrogenase [Hungatella hathewayi]